MTDPPLSCVIPTRNDLGNLPRAVDSVLGYAGATAVVVDDGSNDGTGRWLAVCTRTQARIQGTSLVESGGVGAARNVGLALVGSPFVSFLDSDDVHMPGFYRHALDLLSQFPGAAAVRGTVELETPPDAAAVAREDPRVRAVGQSVVWNLVLRTAVARAIGFPVDPFFKRTMYGDHAFCSALYQSFDVVESTQTACRHTVRAGGHTDEFLARTRVVDNGFVFLERRPEELDGSANRALAAFRISVKARLIEYQRLFREQGIALSNAG